MSVAKISRNYILMYFKFSMFPLKKKINLMFELKFKININARKSLNLHYVAFFSEIEKCCEWIPTNNCFEGWPSDQNIELLCTVAFFSKIMFFAHSSFSKHRF